MRLYLPESSTRDAKRLDRAGVPADVREAEAKGQIALELLDRVRAEGLPGRIVITDAGYGVADDFRAGSAGRGLSYLAGVTEEMVVFAEPPVWVAPQADTGGRPQSRYRPAEDSPRPVSLKELAARPPCAR